MTFISFWFAILFLTFLFFYWILPKTWRIYALVLANALFYIAWDWRFLFLLTASILVDYAVGLRIGSLNSLNDQTRRRRQNWLILSLSFQLLMLGFFKYFNFFSDSLAFLLSQLHISLSPTHLNILLPIGISFYTFKTMTYTLDIYFKRCEPTTSIATYAAYVGFFPELLSGPIDRAKSLLPQILKGGVILRENFQEGAHLIFIGLFKKIYVADSLAPHVQTLLSIPNPGRWEVVWGAVMFYFQLYADFSGYTDIATGLAKSLGFQLALNFRLPYFARNPNDFWQRWHISLSTWLRDYIFTPLGGAFRTRAIAYRNIAVTMLLAGLWHGASVTFLLWGGYHAALLIGHRILQPGLKHAGRSIRWLFGKSIRRSSRILTTFLLVSFGWIIFRAGSWSQLQVLWRGLFHWHGGYDLTPLLNILLFMGPLMILEFLESSFLKTPIYRTDRLPLWGKTGIYAILFYLMAFNGASSQGFIYAQF